MRVNAWVAAGGACLLFAAGAATTLLFTRADAPASAAASRVSGTAPPAARTPDAITLAPDVLQRAGIVTQPVEAGKGSARLVVPGSVQPNAYRKVSVTPLVSGRVTRLLVELGDRIERGATVAEVYSPELAEVRARYLAAQADVEAGETKLRRTERLVTLGSASQQEFEGVRAEHVRHEVELRESAARLRLFGIDPSHLAHATAADDNASVVRVSAPQSGVVIERPAVTGATVEASTPLVTIADLSPVWIEADVYEHDMTRLAMHASATVTSDAYPKLQLHGRVTYIAPAVRPETRTMQVRVEVPNTDGRLKFGMFVNVAIEGPPRSDALIVPASAVQTIGSETVVFIPRDAHTFLERRITIGESHGEVVEVAAGLSRGDRVVTQGSFALRAEAERQGVRPADPPASLTVRITESGFDPNTIQVKAGVPLRLTFVRTTDETCAKDVVLLDYGIRRDLPLNVPVTVEFTPLKSFAFQCGMKMLSGTLMVR